MLADAPRAYWRLGETSGTTAADHLGTYPGTYQGGVTLGVLGAIANDANTAARFDGTDDQVNMGDPAGGALDFGTGDFTAEAWVKTTVNAERTVFSKKASSGNYWQATVTDDGGHVGAVRVYLSAGGGTEIAYGPLTRVDNGAWHHVAIVFDRGVGITIYHDGVGSTKASSSTGDASNSGPFLIGKASAYAFFTGDVDEVALYPSALTPARVQAHYAAGHG